MLKNYIERLKMWWRYGNRVTIEGNYIENSLTKTKKPGKFVHGKFKLETDEGWSVNVLLTESAYKDETVATVLKKSKRMQVIGWYDEEVNTIVYYTSIKFR